MHFLKSLGSDLPRDRVPVCLVIHPPHRSLAYWLSLPALKGAGSAAIFSLL